ncbi:head GIN domain-containing protein [Mucilaginibacter myungsuensis]|uniref:DUF2807 domain-containing protein n=1 Tax=Mucilaginibacter myungsuensis TaxID=649104 RepID=A0A929KSE7_9SPHI|nr:head GIN domain-containing protein [Mucilaginibacter myungsuensis]MBE9660656.1 DUF2807 domain-containing protein [Mucilaginibacter myungsuensis]MDN3600701.1 head GIN domain-containing protein [Mucilaginibacter myungsuensis]
MRTLKTTIALLALLSVATVQSCRMRCKRGTGDMATDNRTVAAFTNINVSGDYKVTLKQDSSFSVSVTADDNLMEFIKTDVSGDELRIKTTRKICSRKQIEVVIGVKDLEELKSSGAIEVTSLGKLNVKDLSLNFSGATKGNLDISAAQLTTKGSGATELTLIGQASRHMVELTGAGKLDAFDLVVGTYDLETTGASKCKINVLNELNVHTTGAGEIEYKGQPTVNSKKTGAASIKQVN